MPNPALFWITRTHLLFAVVSTIVLGTLAAQAEERFDAVGQNYFVSVPLPGFAVDTTPEEFRSTGPTATGHYFTIAELIPAGESFEDWSILFAIKIEEGVDLTLDQYTGQLKDIYFSACDKLFDPMIMTLEDQETLSMFIIPCQSYKDNPAVGEVAVFVMVKHGDTFLNVYQHWRGPAFQGMNPASWPVSSEQLDFFLANARHIDIRT